MWNIGRTVCKKEEKKMVSKNKNPEIQDDIHCNHDLL